MSIPSAICALMASMFMDTAIRYIASSLLSIPSTELPCPVLILPECPVFMACSISATSAPLTSPTIIRSGLILRLDFMSWDMVTEPLPLAPAFLHSICTMFSMAESFSSMESSMTMTLSSAGTASASALSRVVFPDEVPPLTNMLYPHSTRVLSSRAALAVKVPFFIRSSMVMYLSENFLMVSIGPFIATLL